MSPTPGTGWFHFCTHALQTNRILGRHRIFVRKDETKWALHQDKTIFMFFAAAKTPATYAIYRTLNSSLILKVRSVGSAKRLRRRAIISPFFFKT
jgi:hypothetical protein